MSFTRFHDDEARIKKRLEESTFQGRYFLNVPGPGMDLAFHEDPQLRLQKWGANLHNDTVNLESDLHGLTRKANRDLSKYNNHKTFSATSKPFTYKVEQPNVEESRASHPAWKYRALEQPRWETPFLNPQNDLERNFEHNVHTRLLEKDHFVPTIPSNHGNQQYYLTGPSMCIGGKEQECFGTKLH